MSDEIAKTPTVEELLQKIERLKQHIKGLDQVISKNKAASKRRLKNSRTPVTTNKGVYLIARDNERVATTGRHPILSDARTTIKELAAKEHDRFLLLKVVGILDKRPKAPDTSNGNEANT